MKTKFALPIVIPMLAVAASGAYAATMSKAGEIKSIDTAKRELVLTSGDTFELAKGIKADALKTGTRVSVNYESKDGKMLASKVVADKPAK